MHRILLDLALLLPIATGGTAEEAPSQVLVLENDSPEPVLRAFSLGKLGIPQGQVAELIDLDRDIGLGAWRDVAVLPVGAHESRRLEAHPAAHGLSGGFELFAIEDGEGATWQTLDPRAENLGQAIDKVLSATGAVIANHRGTDLLELPPLPLASRLVARVVPSLPLKTRLPERPFERRFAAQSGRVEWALSFEGRPLDRARAWFLCPEAGFYATPLQAVVADGIPAAGGYVIPTTPGLVVYTMDLDGGALERLKARLDTRPERVRVIREAGLAAQAVRAGAAPRGRFEDLMLDRLRRDDLLPGDPYLTLRWSAVPAGNATRVLRTLPLPGDPGERGEPFTEEVLRTDGVFNFAVDVPRKEGTEFVVIVRRAASPAPERYRLLLDQRPVGDPVSRDDGFGNGWRDDVFRIPQEVLGPRQRVMLTLAPDGGTLDVARIGFFRFEPKDGTPLGDLPLDSTDGLLCTIDRAPDGGVLLAGGRAFLTGAALRGSGALRVDLAGRFHSFLARLAVDRRSSPHAYARLRVERDGELLYESPRLSRDSEPEPLTLDVRGARSLVLRVEADPDDESILDLLEARLAELD